MDLKSARDHLACIWIAFDAIEREAATRAVACDSDRKRTRELLAANASLTDQLAAANLTIIDLRESLRNLRRILT